MDKSENPTKENQDDHLDKGLTVEEVATFIEDNQDRKEQLEQQNGFYMALIEQLKQSDRASMGRHVWLTSSLKQSMKAQKQMAAAAIENGDKTPKKGFFARLLGR